MFRRVIIDMSHRDTVIVETYPSVSLNNRHSISHGRYNAYKAARPSPKRNTLYVRVYTNGLFICTIPILVKSIEFDSSKMSMNEVVDSIIGLVAAHDVHDS
jgi:hypothetical protein